MLIHEAIAATGKGARFIRRKSWSYPSLKMTIGGSVKICPTNSPDRCVVFSIARETPIACWAPTAEDLTADDWETVR